MKVDTTLIEAYLNDQSLSETFPYTFIRNFKNPDQKRKDVVKELTSQLKNIIEDFPQFNHTLWNQLFNNSSNILNSIHILPVVGEYSSFAHVEKKDNQFYIVIDLIKVADFTRIVPQMVYILNNYLTTEITKICILHNYAIPSKKYIDILNEMVFAHGLANWLAWNEDCKQYKFQTSHYDSHKEKAFGLLAQAVQVENKALQHKIILNILDSDFWNQFPAVAGMFYFDDLFHDLGEKGILLAYQHGPKDFIKMIYNS